MEPSELLSILSASILLVAYLIYYKKTSEGKIEPNATSWILWVLLIILHAASYGLMTGDLVKAYLSFTSSLAAVAVFINAIRRGAFKKLDGWDFGALIVGVAAVLIWWAFHSATYGNLILQIAFFISVIPTIHGVIEKPSREPALPWFLWGIAFVGLMAVVILRWEGQYQDLIYPIHMGSWHTLVGILALRKPQ